MSDLVDPTTSPVPIGSAGPDTTLRVGSIDPRDAAARALASLLSEKLIFRVSANGKGPDRIGKLVRVLPEFPVEGVPRDLPCASIADKGTGSNDDVDQVLDEESFDEDSETAVAGLEVSGSFSVDVWASDDPERRAIRAAIPTLFRLGDSRGGCSVMLPVDPELLPPAFRDSADRFRVRLTLDDRPRNVDDALSKAEGEFRVNFSVDWDAPEVSVVDVARIDVLVHSGDLAEPGELTGPSDDEET